MLKKIIAVVLVLMLGACAVADDAAGVYVMYGHQDAETTLMIMILNEYGTVVNQIITYDGTVKRSNSSAVGTWEHVVGNAYNIEIGRYWYACDIYDWAMIARMYDDWTDSFVAMNIYYKLIQSDEETFIKQWEQHQQ